MAFVMTRDQAALCRCFGNPSVHFFFLPSIPFYQSVNAVQLLPRMNPLIPDVAALNASSFFTPRRAGNIRGSNFLDWKAPSTRYPKMLPVIAMLCI